MLSAIATVETTLGRIPLVRPYPGGRGFGRASRRRTCGARRYSKQERDELLAREAAARTVAEGIAREAEQARQALQAEVAQKTAILEQMRDGVVVLDRNSRIVLANARAAEIFGEPVEALIGLTPDEFPWEPAEIDGVTGARPDGRIAPELVAGAVRRAGVRMRLRGGVVRWIALGVTQLRDDHGDVIGAVMVGRDVTPEREAAAQADEERSRAARSEKLRAVGQMASGIAHNLNQSLALIAGYAELASEALSADEVDPAALRAYLTIISQAAMTGGETVKRLLTFTRGRAVGTLPTAIDVGALMRGVAELTAPRWRDLARAEGRPAERQLDVPDDICVVAREPDLREALTNLVFNAVDAMPAGGVLRLAARSVDGSDSGMGMSAEVRARIFEPFFSTKGEQGTGLGLAMVFAIVDQHGGTVDVRSAPGQGTTFVLRLPSGERPSRARPTGEPSAAARPIRVLVVDDEPLLRDAIEVLLGRAGHAVQAVESAEWAIEALEVNRYDVVISDLVMGRGMNGWDLAARVAVGWPGTRFVLCSGLGTGIEADEARSRGVDLVLPKPYMPADLRRAVQVASS